MDRSVSLEKAAKEVCIAASKPPLIFQLPPRKGRQKLDAAQDTPHRKYPAVITDIPVSTGKWGDISLRCIKPDNMSGTPGVIFYIHGGGWVFGNLHTHDKLVRELAARTNSVVLFPEYSLSPEAKFPVAVEQCYSVLCALPDISKQMGWRVNLNALTVAGDSAGGNIATVMTILSKRRHGPQIHCQLMYYPVTNAYFNTRSYLRFAEGYYLYRAGMMWFWDQYTSSEHERGLITASPLRASREQLRGLPDAMIVTGQADVLRDEGEAYAAKLRQSGVDVTAVRVLGTIHDFVMLNALDKTNATRIAMDASTSWINRKIRAIT